MKIILAFDSFKGSLTAEEAVNAAAKGIIKVCPHAKIIRLPMADGGEGTTEAICKSLKTKWTTCPAHDPFMRPIISKYAITTDGTTAIMEMAAAAGLTLLDETERNPMRTTTYGVGEMIANAIEKGCKKILIGIGGSATNDCGMGMLAALGGKIETKKERLSYPKGQDCKDITTIDLSNISLQGIEINAICDVTNPLFGKEGAAYVYGKQKGASEKEIEILDKGLQNVANICGSNPNYPGSGAAGGFGYGLALIGATLKKGVDVIIEAAKLEEHLKGADMVITGEGKVDNQTLNNKLPFGVMKVAQKHHIPTIALAGKVANREELLAAGFHAIHCINEDDMPLTECMNSTITKKHLTETTKKLCRNLKN